MRCKMILFSSALALLPLSLAAPALTDPALDPKGLSRVNLVLDNQSYSSLQLQDFRGAARRANESNISSSIIKRVPSMGQNR